MNGAQGTVVGIIYRDGCSPPNPPDIVLVKFDNYLGMHGITSLQSAPFLFYCITGPSCLDDMEKVVPITPITRTWFKKKVMSTRTTVPLNPAYAISIHKSQVLSLPFSTLTSISPTFQFAFQGMTLDNVILNLGNEEFCIGLCYTALSRCKNLNQMAFEPMPGFKRLTCYINRAKFLMRREEDQRLLDLQENTLKKLE